MTRRSAKCAAVPFLEGERLQPHHQSQQPDVELFRGSGSRGINHLLVDGVQGGGFGDPSCDPVDHPDLLSIHITTLEGFPDGGQTCGGAAGAGEQAAHLVGRITQQQRQLVGHKLTRLRPFQIAETRRGCGSGFVGDPRIGVAHRRLRQPRRGRCGLPAGIRHRLPGRRAVMLAITLVTVLVIPRHNFMVAATTDSFRTYERTECRGEASIRTLSNDMLGDGLS